MSALPSTPPRPEADALRELTLRAFDMAEQAASGCVRVLNGSDDATPAVLQAEKELDQLDSEVDERLADAIAGDPVAQARELLACSKFVVDLERIGDLAVNFCNIHQMSQGQVLRADMHELTGMATTLERMVSEGHRAYLNRDLDLAVRVLRYDSEMDRLRNLIFFRHIEDREHSVGPGGVQAVFLAQALERAGDHAKNVAEEVCHLISGHTLRHLLRGHDKPDEVAFIERMKKKIGDGGKSSK
jgi:phosphate transport system protein